MHAIPSLAGVGISTYNVLTNGVRAVKVGMSLLMLTLTAFMASWAHFVGSGVIRTYHLDRARWSFADGLREWSEQSKTSALGILMATQAPLVFGRFISQPEISTHGHVWFYLGMFAIGIAVGGNFYAFRLVFGDNASLTAANCRSNPALWLQLGLMLPVILTLCASTAAFVVHGMEFKRDYTST